MIQRPRRGTQILYLAGLRLGLLLWLTTLAGCRHVPEMPEETSDPVQPTTPPSILLISIDTLRADHLGCYRYARDTSPRIDALAKDAVRFASAFAPTPWTFPSHASMLTGMHPYEIGIDNSFRTIPDEIPIISELLGHSGYQTAAFVDSSPKGFVGADRGFGRGFESYHHAPHQQGLDQRFDMAATVDIALNWLEGRDKSRPFFMFLHTKSVHAVPNDATCLNPRCFPYEKPEPWQSRFLSSNQKTSSWTTTEDGAGQRYLWSLNSKILRGELDPADFPAERLEELKSVYDAGIYYVDAHLGRLFDDLHRRQLFDKSVIVITSDHGEAFLDHSLFMHQEVYDTLLRVPLIVRIPDLPPQVSEDQQVVLADIAPTLLQQAGIPIPDHLTGRSLTSNPNTENLSAPGLNSGSLRDVFSYYLFPSKFTYQSFALRRGHWKLVVHNPKKADVFRRDLYNTAKDPREQWPVSGRDDLSEELRQALRGILREPHKAQGIEFTQQDLPNLDAIRSLGYVE